MKVVRVCFLCSLRLFVWTSCQFLDLLLFLCISLSFLSLFFSRDLDEITKNLQRLRQRCWRLHHKTRYSGMYNNGAGGRVLIKHSDLVNVVCFVFLEVLLCMVILFEILRIFLIQAYAIVSR